MEKKSKIYVAGHKGLVGSALIRTLRNAGYNNIIFRTSAELDLTSQEMTNKFFLTEKTLEVTPFRPSPAGCLMRMLYAIKLKNV